MVKKCPKCNNILDISYFCKDKSTRDGHHCWCRKCRTKSRMKWFNGNKDKHHQSYNQWYARNKENQHVRHSKWCKDNKLWVLNYHRNYRSNNKEKVNQYHRNRNSILRGSKGKFSEMEWLWIKEKYFNMCLSCFRREPEIKLTRDHVVPIIKKGSNYIENIQPLCLECNLKKHIKIIDYRYLYLGKDEYENIKYV